MLAIDAARCAGFRDSLYFFRRNPWLHKINASQEEKEMLIELGRLHQNLRSRQVTLVTARNLYKVFGARFVKSEFDLKRGISPSFADSTTCMQMDDMLPTIIMKLQP